MRTQPNANCTATVHLLDSAQGHPIQTWSFRDRPRILIGRADENDITLADTQVSRLHVELLHEDGGWRLNSHGRNGTLVDGARVAESTLQDGSIFRLGSTGPTFQFLTARPSVGSRATIDNFDPGELDFLVLDEQRQEEEVARIADEETFRMLQQQARRLKHGEDANPPDGGS